MSQPWYDRPLPRPIRTGCVVGFLSGPLLLSFPLLLAGIYGIVVDVTHNTWLIPTRAYQVMVAVQCVSALVACVAQGAFWIGLGRELVTKQPRSAWHAFRWLGLAILAAGVMFWSIQQIGDMVERTTP